MEIEKTVNRKKLKDFVDDYLPPREEWTSWTHPQTGEVYSIALQKAGSVPAVEFEACFKLVELSSLGDYKRSRDGWRPKAKKKEMRLLDLKYLLVTLNGKVEGFCSFMPTTEDDIFVVYCYEIHLTTSLQGTGLGKGLMDLVDSITTKIPEAQKIMLTCFLTNQKALQFYRKLGYDTDDFSPQPKLLRNGTKVEAQYVIMSKIIQR